MPAESTGIPNRGEHIFSGWRHRRNGPAATITFVDPCVFCRIAEGTIPAWVVDEDDAAVAFLDGSPATEGHTLVIPRRHSIDIWDADGDDWLRVTGMVHRVAKQLRDRLQPDGLTIFQANRSVGWQEVFHLHIHLVPRFANDGLVRSWRAVRASPDALDRTLACLRGVSPGGAL